MAKSTGKPSKRPEEVELDKLKRRQVPGITIQSQEDKIIRMAYDLAAERIRKKTATSQELTQFIKAGSPISQLEKEKLQQEIILLKAKTEAIKSQKQVEEMYKKALNAMRTYSGQGEQLD